MRRVYALLAALVAALTLTLGLTGPANAATAVQPWGTSIIGTGGGKITLTSVGTGATKTAFYITYTPGDKPLDGYNILTPTLTYGPNGVVAEVDYSAPATGYMYSGTVAPHTPVTLSYVYDVPWQQLNPATMTVHIGLEDFAWTGNLASKITPPPAPKPASQPPFGS